MLGALGLSLATTAASLVLTVALGLPLAVVLARRTFRGQVARRGDRRPADRPAAVGGRPGAPARCSGAAARSADRSDDAGLDVAFTTVAVVLAQTFVAAPFFVRSARAGIAAVSRDLEDAARVDGASEAQLFRLITVPLASASLAAGLVMTWARALGEFGATIMFAGNFEGRTQTLPLVVYSEFQAGHLDRLDRSRGDPRRGSARRADRRTDLPLGPRARSQRRGVAARSGLQRPRKPRGWRTVAAVESRTRP